MTELYSVLSFECRNSRPWLEATPSVVGYTPHPNHWSSLISPVAGHRWVRSGSGRLLQAEGFSQAWPARQASQTSLSVA